MFFFNVSSRTCGKSLLIQKSTPSLNFLRKYSYTDINSEELLQRSLTHKAVTHSSLPNDSHLRCTIINKKGTIDKLSVDITKKDLLLKYKLMPRDIRKINYQPTIQTSVVPYISVRNDSILIDLLHIRALIQSEGMLLFDSSMDSFTKSRTLKELQEKLSYKNSTELPYELKAFETVLSIVARELESEIKVHKNLMRSILLDLENHIHTQNLRLLLGQNKKIAAFYQKARLIRDVLDDLLQQDDQLTAMYLTTPRTDINDHTEVEILLETYYKNIDETVQYAEEIVNNIKTTQEIINIILDANRNQLMLLGLRFSIGILFLGCGIYVASVYGMNLENFIEEKDWGLISVVVITGIVIVYFFWRSIRKLHGLEKIAISGRQNMPIHRHKKNYDMKFGHDH